MKLTPDSRVSLELELEFIISTDPFLSVVKKPIGKGFPALKSVDQNFLFCGIGQSPNPRGFHGSK